MAAQLTVRPAPQKLVDFTNPTRTNVSEIVVTAAGQPPLASVADLSGREVFVREKGTYHESLLALNDKFKARRWRFGSRRRTSKTTTCSRW